MDPIQTNQSQNINSQSGWSWAGNNQNSYIPPAPPDMNPAPKKPAKSLNIWNFNIPIKTWESNEVIPPVQNLNQIPVIENNNDLKLTKPSSDIATNIPKKSDPDSNDKKSKKKTYSLIKSAVTEEDKQIDQRTARWEITQFLKNADISALINQIFNDAVASHTSDIHIEPLEKFLAIRFRIDGEFYEYRNFAKEYQNLLLTRIQVLAWLKIDELRKPQDWKINAWMINGKRIDMRVSTLPTIYWNKTVIRILEKENKIVTLAELGYDHDAIKLINKNLERTYWMVLMSGPTGSWKSTTLFAMISKFDPFKYNISTLEDPVEYFIEWANQSQVNAEIWFDFWNWLRSLVRQDPDIIMVWEIRDTTTAKLATQAAITGHLVFSTVHANSASSTIQRLINIWADTFLIADALNVIIAQRLLRKNCPNCITQYQPNSKELKYVKPVIEKLDEVSKNQIKYLKWAWCDQCHWSGYTWRLAIYEILEITQTIKKVIIEKNWIADDVEKAAVEEWMVTIEENWILEALKWSTTIDEVMRVVDVSE